MNKKLYSYKVYWLNVIISTVITGVSVITPYSSRMVKMYSDPQVSVSTLAGCFPLYTTLYVIRVLQKKTGEGAHTQKNIRNDFLWSFRESLVCLSYQVARYSFNVTANWVPVPMLVPMRHLSLILTYKQFLRLWCFKMHALKNAWRIQIGESCLYPILPFKVIEIGFVWFVTLRQIYAHNHLFSKVN